MADIETGYIENTEFSGGENAFGEFTVSGNSYCDFLIRTMKLYP